MITKKYACTQSELYQVAATAWRNFNDNLGHFNTYRPIYDNAFYQARLLELELAETMPDDASRTGALMAMRTQLADEGAECLALWQDLKRYISTAFDEDELEGRYNEAGGSHYSKAASPSWGTIRKLMTMGEGFISMHHVTLLTNDNMPTSFHATFTAAKNSFNQVYTDYLQAEEQASVAGQEKIKANNIVYKALREMMLDGQRIYRNDEAMKAMFTFNSVLGLITSPGPARLYGKIKDTAQQAIAHATLKIVELELVQQVNSDGEFDFGPIKSGKFEVMIAAAGFKDKTEIVEINPGTHVKREFVLEPLA